MSDINDPEWRLCTFKHVIVRERSVELKTEFEVLCSLYGFCDTDSFFGVPRPLAFYDPHKPTSFLSVGGSLSSKSRRRPHRSLVSEGDIKLLELDTAVYAMDQIDQVLPIPLLTAKTIRMLFYPPTLCPLYFGKVIKELGPGGRPSRFFNSANSPLDVSRYRKLLEIVEGDCIYPSVEDIAYGMDEMLGCLHWRVGYDGRDVEFVMGGASFSDVAMYIIDFNQMRTWKINPNEIQQLVDAFYTNDPYYPRPNPNDPLYKEFSNGYLSAHPKESRDAIDVGEAFLRAIETEHRRRISANRVSIT